MRTATTVAGWLGMALVLAGAPAGAAPGDVLFSETFERYAEGQRIGAPWSGGFSARGGALHLASGTSNPVCVLDRSFAGDVSFSVRMLGARDSHWTGFAAKGVYWVTVSRENGTLALVKRDQGQVTALGDKFDYYWYLWATRDFELRLDIVGDELRVFADGKLLIQATDPGASSRRGPLWLVGGYRSDTRFDDVRVTESDPTAGLPAAPVSAPSALQLVDARCDRPDSIYDDGQPVTISATLRAKDPAGGTFDVRFEVLDIDEQPVWTADRTLSLPAGGAVTETLTLIPPRRGVFKLRAVQPGTAPPPAVAPPPPPPPPAAAPPPRRGFFKRILARIGRVFTFWKKRPAPSAPPAPAPPPPPPAPVGDAYDDLISFAVIPAAVNDLAADAGSIMGGHPWWEQADEHAALSRRMGQRWARTHDFIQWTWWPRVEPQRGAFRVPPEHDQELDGMLAARQHVLGTFMYTPDWAGATQQTPPQAADFSNYVYRTVQHFSPRITHWEVWNEPYYQGFWAGTAAEYVELCRIAAQTAKSADPQAVIVGGVVDPTDEAWLDGVFQAGLNASIDVLAFHGGYAGSPFQAELDGFEQDLSGLRARMRQNGGERPLWCTETAIMSTSFLDEFRSGTMERNASYHYKEAADALVRMFVAQQAAGVEKVFYYYMARRRPPFTTATVPSFDQNLVDARRGLKPMGVAYATCAQRLAGKRFVTQVDLGPLEQAYVFEGNGEVLVAAWGSYGRDPAERDLHLGAAPGATWRVDIMNNEAAHPSGPATVPFSRRPLLLRVTGATPQAVASWLQAGRIQPR